MKHSKIKDLREDHDLTQCDVANLLGIKRSTYAMWELGDVNFPVEKLTILAEALHTNIEYLLGISIDKRPMKYPPIDNKFIGQQLRTYRTKLKLTQKDFASTLGIYQSSYSYYEDGRSKIPTDKLVYLAKVYRISLNDLCGGISDREKSLILL